MKKMWKGLLAFAMLLVFCVVAFSPGTAQAVDKAAFAYTLISNLHQLEPVKTAGGGADRYDKQSAPQQSLSSPYVTSGAAARTSQDGYMNWRMRETTRNV